MESHHLPAQLERLVTHLVDPPRDDVLVVVNHDSRSRDDLSKVAALPGVVVRRSPGGYSDGSHIRRYLDTAAWLRDQGLRYEWLSNLSGQDYPLRPPRAFEDGLREDVDGYLLAFPAFSPHSPWGPRLSTTRYHFRHSRLTDKLSPRAQQVARGLQAVNYVQPWVRLTASTGLTLGVRRHDVPFSRDLACYGGSAWCTLREGCVAYLLDYDARDPGLRRYLATTLAGDEVFIQTVLVNARRFRLVQDNLRFITFAGSTNNSPRTLTSADLSSLRASNAGFARKFDTRVDAAVLDALDAALAAAG